MTHKTEQAESYDWVKINTYLQLEQGKKRFYLALTDVNGIVITYPISEETARKLHVSGFEPLVY